MVHTEQKSLTEEEAEPGTGSSTQTTAPAPVPAQPALGWKDTGCPGYTAPKRSRHAAAADGALHTEHRWCFVLHIHPSWPAVLGCRHHRLLGQRPSLHGCMNSAENER